MKYVGDKTQRKGTGLVITAIWSNVLCMKYGVVGRPWSEWCCLPAPTWERTSWFIGVVMWCLFVADRIGNNFVPPRQNLTWILYDSISFNILLHAKGLWRSPNDNLWISWVVPFLPTKPLKQLNGGNNEIPTLQYPASRPLGRPILGLLAFLGLFSCT